MDHYEISDIARRRYQVPKLVNVEVEANGKHFILVIENIGDIPVYNLVFKFPIDFIWPGGQSKLPNAFKTGIKCFPSRRKMKFYYSSKHSIERLANINVAKEFTISISYNHPEIIDTINEDFSINLNDFSGSNFEINDIDRLILVLEEIRDNLCGMRK